jgi:beta-N-acetylhexosaminidase
MGFKFSVVVLLSFFCVFVSSGQGPQSHCVPPVFLQKPTPWADSLVQTMSLDQKIGQLFMVAAWSDPRNQSYDADGVEMLIRKFGIGGIIFFQGGPVRQARLTNRYQSAAEVPLMVGMDAEWGLGMRLDSTISYPRQLAMGAARDESLVYDFGIEMARQLKRLGVHISFSPVVDINNNPRNPVISNRSFGEDRDRVTRASYQYMNGLQDAGVLANAKHFPGHGDTDSDSHKDLPVIPYSRERLDSLELYPYHYLFNYGLSSVMIAHLYVPALDDTPNRPSTLSPKIVNGLLRGEMGFEGLVFTDALNMQGVTKYFSPGEADVQALIAGNDVILYPLNVAIAIEKIKLAIQEGRLTEVDITSKCLKVLRAKEWAGLNSLRPVRVESLVEDLNAPKALLMRKRIVEGSITVVRNDQSLAPLCYSDTARVALLIVGAADTTEFERTMARYARFDTFRMEKNPGLPYAMELRDKLIGYDLVVAALVNTSNKVSRNFGVTNESARVINSIGEETGVIMCLFANPYALQSLKELDEVETIVVGYQDDNETQRIVAEVLAGACTATGRLPVSTSPYFEVGDEAGLNDRTRLRWVSPIDLGLCGSFELSGGNLHRQTDVPLRPKGVPYKEDMMADRRGAEMGYEENCFRKVDEIALEGIRLKAYPGCRVLASWKGNVIYDKSFGHLDWDQRQRVTSNTVYDLASITKVVSSTLALMKLVEEGKVSMDSTLGCYIELPPGNPYHRVSLKAMLSHTAGFKAWIPFYQSTIQNGQLAKGVYTVHRDSLHCNQVADSLFIMNSYRDSIFQQILRTPISKDLTYLYSDLGYYFVQRIVEKESGVSLDEYVNSTFYRPLGLESMGYNPLTNIDAGRIAPTEWDKIWRKQHLRGFVHDQGAAMMGGVAGHAGVFSTAQDLAVVMQMLLDGGIYGGIRFLSPEIIDQFNTRYFEQNRRGLGFDKPSLSAGSGSTCKEASERSFGHTGFTGTMCWADPENGLVYIFLSNRVNPDAENNLLQTLDVRTRIQHEFYEVIESAGQ